MQAAKYFRGTYALCERCGSKPCVCAVPAAAPAPVRELHAAPASGNAIPFIVWDVLIDAYELSVVESGVLLFLCRRTIGYGHHLGALLSITDIAYGLRIGRASAKRALDRLDAAGLIERNRRNEAGSKEYAHTHIRVTLPAS